MGKTKILAITPLLLAMYGCSGSDSAPTTTTTTTAVSGLFLDAEVEGLTFTTDSGITGQTDANGTYNYLPGEQVSFSVGGVNIGTVDGAPKCTPFDFAAASTNIARFLQSLDADGDPTNGIDIVDANTALAGTTITSDVFVVDTATFEANTAITDAITDGGGTLISEQDAINNLNLGTDDTFEYAELEGKLFVVIDPIESDIGIISFDTIASGAEVYSVFAGETTDAGGDGLGADETWSVGTDGVLILTDTVDGIVTTVNRIGGSTSSISVTHSEDGAVPLPATLLIPQVITANDLGGDGVSITSKTYDVIDADGTPINVTFKSDGTFTDNTNNETGTYEEDNTPGVILIVNDSFPDEVTFMIVMDGDPNVLGQTANILLLGAIPVGGTPIDPILSFINIGVGSVTLVTSAP